MIYYDMIDLTRTFDFDKNKFGSTASCLNLRSSISVPFVDYHLLSISS